MSTPNQPVPVQVVSDGRPTEVIVVSHSSFFYWWPVWMVGFLMAGLSWMEGYQMAIVPPGTVAERKVVVPGHEGARDILITPAGKSLPVESDSDKLQQPRLRMASSNNPGVIWAVTLCLVILVTHVKMRGVWSVVMVVVILSGTILFAVLGIWDVIFGTLQFIDIHINAVGYLSISLFLFVLWVLMFFVFDRLNYMIFTRGRLRVRQAIGEGEKVFDMRGMMLKRHRDDMFRHWLLGFGTADLTVFTSGANAQQLEMINVVGIDRKLHLINDMLQELEVVKGR